MKPQSCLLLVTLLAFSSTNYAQKIMMRVSYAKPAAYGDAEEIRALEFKINAAVSYTSGSGAAVGKPMPSELVVKKNVDSTTNGIFRKIIQGTFFPFVKIEYYDKNDLNYYTITITDAFVTQLYFLSPECPSCIKLEHQLGFVFKTLKIEDKINNTNTTWDISTMIVN
jgi:type VI protein secretion system component Hcp